MKAQRRLWAGTMATDFLNTACAPRVFASSQDLVRLWTLKSKVAPGVPFSALEDVRYAALDGIWAAAVGTELGGLAVISDAVAGSGLVNANDAGQAEFPSASIPPLISAIDLLLEDTGVFANDMVKQLQVAFLPKLWCDWRWPEVKAARILKDKTMRQLLHECRAKFSEPGAQDRKPTCAMEQVLQREAANREKGAPSVGSDDDNMIDELFVWLVAGSETSVTTISWGLKHLADNPGVQRTLRDAIREGIAADTITSAAHLLNANIPYLDAVVWEMLRLARTAAAVMRNTTVDTTILGAHVPKGTAIIMSTSGFTALDDHLAPVDEKTRSQSSRLAAQHKPVPWDYATISRFDPDRWLKTNEGNGKTEFDLNAGPILSFGGGPRGCFGRRLAMIELKLLVAQLVLNFEFGKLPEGMNDYLGYERVTRQPRTCFVRPVPVSEG
ncbi:hypothetical protein MRB53_037914 [Persea americana]|nr:hypothetical protein MRB53_037914 [Persea americana]